MKYCFGVDIGGTTVKLGLFTTDGEIVDKWEIKTRTENQGEAVLPDIAEALKEKLEEKKIDRDEVEGIGVGVPAPVNTEGVVQNTANLGWGYKEVKREMEELSGMRAEIGNDANVAALGEMWLGAGKGRKNIVMVTLGTGVGGGIIIDGKPLVGAHGAGGEIGHLCVNYEETDHCGCGNTGCLEQYASATGITRLANIRLAKDDAKSVLREQEVSAKTVFDAVKAGDAVAKEIAEEFGKYLGHAMANLAAVADPSAIVIGGGVSKAGEVLIEYVEKNFKERAFFANKDTEFVLATLGNDAGICGAAKLILS
ncbi:ROK family glucokinase [Dorea longicatena]|jgi:glucokinase-like ROK family protein|uniref:ROK family glucokinase n=1 Tax=Dorea TaxID=189330 RepID=UPI0015704B1D|nr:MULTISPECIES: ROK family glucokinase [Dorea]MCB5535389.1 ROK family glucokinase [bacterium MSK17_88]MCB5545778.1 ROK family glucokinase [Dorea longicatena]MCG4573560.1 ROK family glucokinase [Dorea longicatena]MED9703216.1 ROK family glucokinase [Dorea sp.]NSD68426.1 ROK family glucokinase [Dorea longicatena]